MLYNAFMPSRERSFRVEAVVLRHSDWGEADRLLWLFTRQMGKVRAVAKGARKLHSRKAGHLEPMTQTSLLLARGRDILLVTQAETLQAFTPLREDLALYANASYVIELLDRFTYEEGENVSLFRLLADTLVRLAEGRDANLVTRYYELRLLDHVGFRPQLFRCVVCDKEIQAEDQYFSAQLGGALCPSCGSVERGARAVSLAALKYLRHLQRSSFAAVEKVQLAAPVNREMEGLMQYYLTYLLERALNTPDFLRQVRRFGDGSE
ncbi:MAG: DNA repair protein RecO, partial [Chloroflexi bacterium]|nr:DNA repair protein RecO [Chloroflexota bacterium]